MRACLIYVSRTHLCIPLCQTGEYIFSIKRLGLDVLDTDTISRKVVRRVIEFIILYVW